MNELVATGPVLKAGPIAAFTDVMQTAARAERAWLREGMVMGVQYMEWTEKIDGSQLAGGESEVVLYPFPVELSGTRYTS